MSSYGVRLGAFLTAAGLAGCGHTDSPLDLAQQTTQAIYSVDVEGAEAHMDDDVKKQVTRAGIGELSDKMHALGAYSGLKSGSADADHGRYAFEAAFDRGTLVVDMRLDPAGKIAAYRVSPVTR